MATIRTSFEEAKLLPTDQFHNAIRQFLTYVSFCDSYQNKVLQSYCQGLDCRNGVCHNLPANFESYEPRIDPSPDSSFSYGSETDCFDEIFCRPQSLASILHTIFGLFGLLTCLFGLLANGLSLPAFSFHGKISGTELYLMGLVISDIVYLILTTLLSVAPYIPLAPDKQTQFYSGFSAHLIPWLMPFRSLAQVASTWLILGLLFDRFIYIRYGLAGKESYTRKRVSVILTVLMICLAAYQLPRLFEYNITCHHMNHGKSDDSSYSGLRVVRSSTGNNQLYLNLIYSHLRIPINYTMPLIFTVLLFSLICVRMPTRGEASKRQAKFCDFTQDATAVNQRRLLVHARERRFVELSLFLGAALVVQLFVYLVYDCLRLESETPPWKPGALNSERLWIWEVTVNVLDFLFPALRPFAYAFTCHEYMRALRDTLCCRKTQEDQLFYSINYKEAASYDDLQMQSLNA